MVSNSLYGVVSGGAHAGKILRMKRLENRRQCFKKFFE